MSAHASRLIPKDGFKKPDKKIRPQQSPSSGAQKKKAPHKK